MIGLVQGNALAIPLADRSVQCIITSPPYWGLRSYAGTATWEGGDAECDHMEYEKPRRDHNGRDFGDTRGIEPARVGASIPYRDICRKCGARRIDAQLGSEPLHDCLGWATGHDCGECYICHMRQVARECWRVLRDDGVMFWNIADSYNSQPAGNITPSNWPGQTRPKYLNRLPEYNTQKKENLPGLKPKDKCGIPERTALAFQADGWYWRSGITWVKPNPMPESVTDRPTKSTEMVYLFAKQERYYWDAEAVREEQQLESKLRATRGWNGDTQRDYVNGPQNHINKYFNKSYDEAMNLPGRNLRDAWNIATAPYPGQHFATFPPELPRRCIKAGTSERGACPKCGKPWEGITETGYQHINFTDPRTPEGQTKRGWDTVANKVSTTLGWRVACACDAGDPVPCVVLDPFSGAATTGIVARELGRRYIGLELSGEYLKQSRDRLSLTALDEWANGSGNGKAHSLDDLPMFKGIA